MTRALNDIKKDKHEDRPCESNCEKYKDSRMFTYRGGQFLLSHFATKHELTLTEGLVFSNNKLNQKNVDLLLDVLFPS